MNYQVTGNFTGYLKEAPGADKAGGNSPDAP